MNEEKGIQYEQDFNLDMHKFEVEKAREAEAKKIVNGAILSTGVTGAIPIPFADAPLLIGQQAAMMAAINKVYDIQMGDEALKSLAAAVLGASGVTVLGKTIVTNVMKLVPGAGTVAGGAISAGTAAALTLALGNAYIDVCQQIKNGTLRQGELKAALKRKFKSELKRSKK